MKKEVLKEYLVNGRVDIDQMLEDFYGYCYLIVRNSVSIAITEEDIEEILSDIFVAIWKNSTYLPDTLPLKPYLAGIAKNMVKNKYRKTEFNVSYTDYEETLLGSYYIETMTEEKEQEQAIFKELHKIKPAERQIFVILYYATKSTQQIAKSLAVSIIKVKTTLHRVRKKLKKNLEDGGYGYGR